MKTQNNYKKTAALVSTILEILPGIAAYFILPKATAIGVVLGVFSVLGIFLAAKFFPHHRFLKSATPDSASYHFWRGQLWKCYLSSMNQRGSMIMAVISDTWVLVVMLGYAFWASNPIFACAILGFASAYSLVTLMQYFEDTK